MRDIDIGLCRSRGAGFLQLEKPRTDAAARLFCAVSGEGLAEKLADDTQPTATGHSCAQLDPREESHRTLLAWHGMSSCLAGRVPASLPPLFTIYCTFLFARHLSPPDFGLHGLLLLRV